MSCFRKDVQDVIIGRYPDHLPKSYGNRFSLYLSTKLCYGIALALKIQVGFFTSKYILSSPSIIEYYRLCVRLRAVLLYVGFSLLDSFTTCCGLHGHLRVCRILHLFIFIYMVGQGNLTFYKPVPT
jgi:hypothetical protein